MAYRLPVGRARGPSDPLDSVEAYVSYVLPAGVDYLTLGGDLAINGTGNALNNQILGNAADNVLSGGGGSDLLIGGLGNDT